VGLEWLEPAVCACRNQRLNVREAAHFPTNKPAPLAAAGCELSARGDLEAFAEGVLLRLAGLNVLSADAAPVRPFQDRVSRRAFRFRTPSGLSGQGRKGLDRADRRAARAIARRGSAASGDGESQ